jgi:hypothetical protein
MREVIHVEKLIDEDELIVRVGFYSRGRLRERGFYVSVMSNKTPDKNLVEKKYAGFTQILVPSERDTERAFKEICLLLLDTNIIRDLAYKLFYESYPSFGMELQELEGFQEDAKRKISKALMGGEKNGNKM